MELKNIEYSKLKNVIKIIPSGVTPFQGEKSYIDTSSVKVNKIINTEPITYDERPSRANMKADEGCILFAKAKNTNKVLLINSENCNNIYSTGFFVIKPNSPNILSEYLYYYFIFNETNLLKDRLAQGSTQVAINNFILYNKFRIPVFDIETQKKIVMDLQSLERILFMLENQVESIRLLLEGVREKIFNNIDDFILLKNVKKVLYRYPTFYGFKYVEEGIPVLKISNMTEDSRFNNDKSSYDFITQDINIKYPKTIVSTNDLVMEVRGTYIGRCALVPKFLEGANISPNTIRISLNKNKILPRFFWYFTFTEKWKSQIAKITNYWKEKFGTIKSEEIETIKIPIISIDKQKKVVDRLNKIFRIYEQFSDSYKKGNILFQTILARYFSMDYGWKDIPVKQSKLNIEE